MHLVTAAGSADPAAAGEDADLAAHASSRWIAGCERCRSCLLRQCELAGFIPKISFTTDDYLAVQALVAAGLGVATLPELCLRAARHPGIATAELPGARRHVFALTYGQPPDPAVTTRLVSALADVAPAGNWRLLRRLPAVPRRGRAQMFVALSAQYGSRSLRLSSLPLGSRGSSAVKSMDFGHFILASRPSSPAKISAASSSPGSTPSAGWTTALICSPQSSSGMPKTATSATLGFMMISASISAG